MFYKGHTLGRDIEADFNRKAAESGLTEKEAKNAFNQNMASIGLLAYGPNSTPRHSDGDG